MRNRIVKVIAMVLATVLLTGADCTTAGEQTETRADSILDNVLSDTIDNIMAWDNDRMTEILKNRNGKIIIEVIESTVLDDDGNACNDFGF